MDAPSDDIMEATFCALCDRGYADLTMRDIAAEASCSKAALHYHYDSKHGLLVAFLDYLYDRFVDRTGDFDADDLDGRLREFLDSVLHPPREDAAREFRTALLEIKAQAPYDEAFRERLAAFDEHIAGTVGDLVAAGVEDGVYRADVDPDETARFVLTVLDGAQSRHVVAGEDVDAVQATLESYLDDHLRSSQGASA